MTEDPNVLIDDDTGRQIDNLVRAAESVGWKIGANFEVSGGGGYTILSGVTLVIRDEDREEIDWPPEDMASFKESVELASLEEGDGLASDENNTNTQ